MVLHTHTCLIPILRWRTNIGKLRPHNTFSFRTRFLNSCLWAEPILYHHAEHIHLFNHIIYFSLLANCSFWLKNFWNKELTFTEILLKKKKILYYNDLSVRIYSTHMENLAISKVLKIGQKHSLSLWELWQSIIISLLEINESSIWEKCFRESFLEKAMVELHLKGKSWNFPGRQAN